MKRTTKLVAALTGVVVTAALLPGAAASGNGTPPAITGGGVLRLHMGSDGDYFRFMPPSGSTQTVVTQAISATRCAATLDPASPLVTLAAAPSPSVVGLFDHGLGVKVAAEGTGTPCGRVDGLSQSLTLTLAGPLRGKLISFAELDIEGKFDVIVRAQTYQGSALVGTTLLPTGSRSDSGPDSADGDNYRMLIPDRPGRPYDRLVLSVDPSTPTGAFSLEGGNDGTKPLTGGLGEALQTSDSVFQLADFAGVLDCGDSSGNVGGGGTPTADLTRGENPDCQPIPYLLRTSDDSSGQSVLLSKDLTGQNGANFRMQVVWDPEPAPVGPLPPTAIDYDGDGGNPPQPIQWCGGTPASPTLPRGQAWCLVSQQVVLAGSGNVQLTEGYFGAGDPVWFR
jgi:hypothetical protein